MTDTPRPDPLRSESVRLKDGRTATIRPGREDDAPQVLEAVNSIGAEHVYIMAETIGTDVPREQEWIRGHDGTTAVFLVAEVDGRIAGTADAECGRFPKDAHVATVGIAVRDGYREVGLGRAMMDRLLEWARDRQARKVTLQVFSTNARALALYRKLGFEVEGVRWRHYKIRGEWVDDVLMGMWIG